MKHLTAYKATDVLSLAAALILVAVPFHALLTTWAISTWGHPYLIKSWKELIILALTPLTLWLIFKSAGLKHWFLNSWLVRLIAFYFAWHIVMGIWAVNAGNVNQTALANGLVLNLRFPAFLIICLVAAYGGPFLYKNWGKIVIAPALAVASFGLAQHFLLPRDFLRHFGYGPATIQPYQTVDANLQYVRVQSFLRGANPLGAYLVIVITSLLGFWRKNRLLLAAALIGSLTVLFYSYSRSAWVGAILSLGVFGWLSLRKTALLWLAVGGTTIALSLGGIYALQSNRTVQDIFFHHTVNSKSPQTSNVVRNSALKNGALDAIHHPMGKGPGTAGPASFRNERPLRIAENYYIQLVQEVGVIGLAAFLGILSLIVKALWPTRQELLPKIILSTLVGISFINLVSHAWADDTLSLLWWGLAGVALAQAIKGPAILAKKAKLT